LATALGRGIRHIARRRRELDWLAADIAGHALAEGAGARAHRILAPLDAAARFPEADPARAEPWLDPPLHRLLCGVAAGLGVLLAAGAGPAGPPLVAAALLLGGRL
ncbi:hypothetical protein, partial [Paracraurococcus ruber]|uniref:hypothetical protein n=1 Tax=Paracraurococcus ruber TaxID=77675 RepID=UPI0013053E93